MCRRSAREEGALRSWGYGGRRGRGGGGVLSSERVVSSCGFSVSGRGSVYFVVCLEIFSLVRAFTGRV